MTTAELISPQDFPAALAMFIGLVALVYATYKLCAWLWRWSVGAVRRMFARWDEEDEAHFREVRRNHQKLHEYDGRGF